MQPTVKKTQKEVTINIPSSPTTKVSPYKSPADDTVDDTQWNRIETEEETASSIYSRLKEAACLTDPSRVKKVWERVESQFRRPQYKNLEKRFVEKLDDDYFAPIHHAVRCNNAFICQKLLDKPYSCNVNLVGWKGRTPLHLAANSTIIDSKFEEENASEANNVLYILLKCKKIKVNIQDDDGRTPLHYAMIRKHRHIIGALIAKRADVEMQDVRGATPIHYAYKFMNKRQIMNQFGLSENEWGKHSFELKTIDDKTPFEMAVESDNHILVEVLLRTMPSKNYDYSVKALVLAAVRSENTQSLPQLQLTDNMIDSIILTACREKNGYRLFELSPFREVLIEEYLMRPIEKDGMIPLMVAIKYRRTEFIDTLLKDKRFKNCRWTAKKTFFLQQTVLHLSAKYGNAKICSEIVARAKDEQTDLAIRDAIGKSPLHICAENNNIDLCKILLETDRYPSNSGRQNNSSSKPLELLKIRNNEGLTPFHRAIENGHHDLVEIMINAVQGYEKYLIEDRDEEDRTSLHIAASKGHVKILRRLLEYDSTLVHSLDIRENTPLHEAARWSDSSDEKSENRIACIEYLIEKGADVNALNLRRESTLLIACRYALPLLVECLLNHEADLLHTNIDGYNCLEVAIDEKNERVVKCLIEHDQIFDLMRNAQLYYIGRRHGTVGEDDRTCACCCLPCRICCIGMCHKCARNFRCDGRLADTPMRKLIITMPDMAYEILNKCTKTIGSDKSTMNIRYYDYEFLEDQYSIYQWVKGNLNSNSRGKQHVQPEHFQSGETYTFNSKTLVMNHPLFLMATHDQYKLMSHPLSKKLVYDKFLPVGLIAFIIIFLLYAAFLGLFTAMIFRSEHPETYYNMTNIDFKENLCSNVTRALGNTAKKDRVDYSLRTALYALIAFNMVKNLIAFIAYIRINPKKILTFFMEISAIGLCFGFLYDSDFQVNYTMRCPLQWQYGAVGLLIGYFGVFYYMQYVPVLGLYVLMLQQILIRFLLFMPFLMVLVSGFAIAFFMIFENFDSFSNMGIALAKIAIMSTGEIGYDEFMHNDDTTAYYKVGFVLLTLFSVVMTILVANLLIGLAVGDIESMMNTAKDVRLDMLFELTADIEIIKYGFEYLPTLMCKGFYRITARPYDTDDLTNEWRHWKSFKKGCLKSCAREAEIKDLDEESDDDEDTYQRQIIEAVREEVRTKHQPQMSTTASNRMKQAVGRATIMNKLAKK